MSATNMCEMIDTGFNCHEIRFSAEAHFWLNGYVNLKNNWIYDSEKAEFVVVKPPHQKKGHCLMCFFFTMVSLIRICFLSIFLKTRFTLYDYHEY